MGSSKERHDGEGREKVQCRICKDWYHRLDVHVSTAHKLNVGEYLEKYPGAPTISEAARAKAAQAQGGKFKGAKATKDKAVVDDDSFKFGVARLKMRTGLTEYDRAFIPKHDEDWIPGEVEQRQLEELALGVEDGDNVLIIGPHGIGKSTLALELAAICDQPVRRVHMDGDIRRADFVGEKNVVVDKDSGQAITRWLDGVLPDAAERGHWLLIEEIDAMPAHIGFILHGVLERHRHLAIMGDRGREVKFHPHFRIIATGNTLGHGDDSGMYAGTNVLNEAFLDRWGTTIRGSYPAAATEVAMLVKRTGIEKALADKMVQVAAKVREAQRQDQCVGGISPRRMIDWAQKTVRMNDPRRAARLTVTNKLGPDDAKFVDNLIQRHFGGGIV